MVLGSLHMQKVEVPELVIRAYIEYELNQDAKRSRRLTNQIDQSPALREQILSTVTDRAHGSFLVAKTFMQNLKFSGSEMKTLELLANMPNNLQDAYSHYLERLEGMETETRKTGEFFLALCATVSRPLTVPEVEQALALRTREERHLSRRLHDYEFYDDRARPSSIENVVAAAQNLVTIEDDPITGVPQCSMHLTLRQHLISDTRPQWLDDHYERIGRLIARLLNHKDLAKPVANQSKSELQLRLKVSLQSLLLIG